MGVLGVVHAHTITGRVVDISDGRTISLLNTTVRQHKIRLDGLDVPDSRQLVVRAAKRNLSDLAFSQEAVSAARSTVTGAKSVACSSMALMSA